MDGDISMNLFKNGLNGQSSLKKKIYNYDLSGLRTFSKMRYIYE